MPLNLPPEAKAAWNKYLEAITTTDKIRLLEEYLKLVPHHKGMANHLRQCKTKLAKLKTELQEEKLAKARITKGEQWMVPKEGDIQIALLGMPFSGKSSLLNYLCQRKVTEEGDHPFTTIKPVVGSAYANGALLQIIELPGVIEHASEGAGSGPKIFAQARNADLIALVIDLSTDPIFQLKLLLKELENAKIKINVATQKIYFQRTGKGGQAVIGADEYFEGGLKEAKNVLTALKIVNCTLKITAPTTVEELVSTISKNVVIKKGIIFATKGDIKGSKQNFIKLKEYIKETLDKKLNYIALTTKLPVKKPEELNELLFNQLDYIRVYTRNDKGEVAKKPIVLRKNSTVEKVAEVLGKNFIKHFRFARIWGNSIKFQGQRVGLEHVLNDGDQIQIYA